MVYRLNTNIPYNCSVVYCLNTNNNILYSCSKTTPTYLLWSSHSRDCQPVKARLRPWYKLVHTC